MIRSITLSWGNKINKTRHGPCGLTRVRQKKMKYALPIFLDGVCTQAAYEKWLRRRVAAHVKRDRKRLKKKIKPEDYRVAIHQAVIDCGGIDYLTKERLDWSLLSRYVNSESKKHGGAYKKQFALLPSVDHDLGDDSSFKFRICSWRTNDAKNDLTLEEFRSLCRLVLCHS